MYHGLERAYGGENELVATPACHLLPVEPAASPLPVGGGHGVPGCGRTCGEWSGRFGVPEAVYIPYERSHVAVPPKLRCVRLQRPPQLPKRP